MARFFVRASTQYLGRGDTCGISDFPFTFSCFFNGNDASLNHSLMVFGDTDAQRIHSMNLRDPPDSDVIAYTNVVGQVPANTFAKTTTSWVANTWQHAAAVFAAANDRRVFLDAEGKGTQSTSVIFGAGLDNITIGAARQDSSISNPLSGALAEVALWNVALFDWEIALLALQWSPLFIRRQNLVFYCPLWAAEDDNVLSGLYKMTPYGGPTIVAHPFIRMPRTGDPLWHFVKEQYRPLNWWPYAPEAVAAVAKTSYVSII
jgi:hypothetical protein